jgi:hypothetical protein
VTASHPLDIREPRRSRPRHISCEVWDVRLLSRRHIIPPRRGGLSRPRSALSIGHSPSRTPLIIADQNAPVSVAVPAICWRSSRGCPLHHHSSFPKQPAVACCVRAQYPCRATVTAASAAGLRFLVHWPID